MPIGDLFAKLGRGETLTPGEIDAIRLQANEIQLSSRMAADALAGSGRFPNNAWKVGQLDTIRGPCPAAAYSCEDQAVPSGAFVEMPVSGAWHGTTPEGVVSFLQIGIYIRPLFQNRDLLRSFIVAFFYVRWTANATGEREIRLSFFDTDNNAVAYHDLQLATGLGQYQFTGGPYSLLIAGLPLDRVTASVRQTSGGDLNLEEARVTLMKLY